MYLRLFVLTQLLHLAVTPSVLTPFVPFRTMLAYSRTRTVRVSWCKCTGGTTKQIQQLSLVVLSWCCNRCTCTTIPAQPVRAHKSANMVSANMVSANMVSEDLKDDVTCFSFSNAGRGS